MDGRDRFTRTINYKAVDRPPLFEDGIRQEVISIWHQQGLDKRVRLESLFTYDPREEIEPNLEPIPTPAYWPKTSAGLNRLRLHWDPNDPSRLPVDWDRKIVEWKTRDYPLILRVHRGYFLTMGVHGWHRFTDAIQLLVDDPLFVEKWLNTFAEFTCRLVDRILSEIQVDAVLFSEPIGGNHGPLISPALYSSLVLNSYRPILEIIRTHNINIFIYRTYANTRALLPSVVKAGFNCLWACETDTSSMNYANIRSEYGKDLRLIGGIDSDTLRQSPEDISRSILELVPGLLQGGGYIPLADGRVREDVPFNNYVHYRKLLESTTGAAKDM